MPVGMPFWMFGANARWRERDYGDAVGLPTIRGLLDGVMRP
jgi:hypothetical protein